MRTAGATWLRVVTYQVEAGNARAEHYMEHTVVDCLHVLEHQPGFQLGYWGRDESAGTMTAVTYWRSRQAIDDALPTLHQLQAEAAAHGVHRIDVRNVRLFAVSADETHAAEAQAAEKEDEKQIISKSFLDNAARTLSGTYTFDPDSSHIGFEARHAMVTKVRGAFHEFTGTAVLDGEDPSRSKVELVIEVASLGTGNNKRDDHLRTNDFFDVTRFPQIRFTSTEIRQVDRDAFRLTGNLTIKGVVKSISVDFTFTGAVEDAWGNQCAGFEGRTEVNRRDWGVNFNGALEAGGVLVSDKATLIFDISAVKRLEHPGAHHSGRPIEDYEADIVVPVIPGVMTSNAGHLAKLGSSNSMRLS